MVVIHECFLHMAVGRALTGKNPISVRCFFFCCCSNPTPGRGATFSSTAAAAAAAAVACSSLRLCSEKDGSGASESVELEPAETGEPAGVTAGESVPLQRT